MNARYYGSNTNRWLSPDTIVPDSTNPQSYNRYSYVRNNPILFSDPSGHIETVCGGGGNSGGECGWNGNTWLGEWLGFDNIQEPVDIGVGVSLSGSVSGPTVSLEGNVAREEVFDVDTGERTTFLVLGGDVSYGPDKGFVDWVKNMLFDGELSPISLSASPYLSFIHNVDDVVEDYSGLFHYDTTTATYQYGVTFGEAYSPRDPERDRAYSETAGLAFGYALTANQGSSYYIPIKTHQPGQIFPTFHNPIPYVKDLFQIVFGE